MKGSRWLVVRSKIEQWSDTLPSTEGVKLKYKMNTKLNLSKCELEGGWLELRPMLQFDNDGSPAWHKKALNKEPRKSQ